MKYFIIGLILITSCTKVVHSQETNLAKEEISKQLGGAVLWYQQSAEMRMAYYQAYEYAKLILREKLENTRNSKPPAVVLDIDETVLDNSPYESYLIDNGDTYSSSTWKKWTDQARASALPGALDFVNYAKSRGVEVFYISNRKVAALEPTLKNLRQENFPNALEKFVLLKEKTSDKTNRRQKVNETHNVMVYIGDNLTDYSEDFANRNKDMGKDLVDKRLSELLSSFVMLPNPMYGEWEKAIYGNDFSISNDEKLKRRNKAFIR